MKSAPGKLHRKKRKAPLWCYNPTSCYLWHWEGFKTPTLLTGGPKLKGHSQTWTVFWRSSPFSTDRLHQAFGVQIEERGHETPGKEGKLESSTLATKPSTNLYLIYESKSLQLEVEKFSDGKHNTYPERRRADIFFFFLYRHVTFVNPAVKRVRLGGQKSWV